MPTLGIPHADVREAADVHIRPTTAVQAHVRNEELVANLEQKEGGVPASAKPLLVVADEAHDLLLCEAESIQISLKTAEDGPVVAILNHLVNLDGSFRHRSSRNIQTPVFEVGINAPGEYVRGGSNSLRANGGTDDDLLAAGDESEDSGFGGTHSIGGR